VKSCAYKSTGKPTRFCGLAAQDGSDLCPRHTFLHNLEAQQSQQKETERSEAKQAAATTGKKRAELVGSGYKFSSSARCSGCNAHIEWWKTPNLKSAPYDPIPHPDSSAVSHFATCPKRQQFRKGA
jgi:hypothetical protein